MKDRDVTRTRPWIGDDTLTTQQMRVEQKRFFFDLKENSQGRYLRITERSGGKSAIVVPESGWDLFTQVLTEVLEKAGKIKSAPQQAAPPPSDPTPDFD